MRKIFYNHRGTLYHIAPTREKTNEKTFVVFYSEKKGIWEKAKGNEQLC